MGGEVLIFISLFIVIFGIAYLHFTTRNKERLALIEKGADASIFVRARSNREAPPVWKVIILNLGLLMTGIGVGILLASILAYNINLDEDVAYPGTIFLTGGMSLVTGFFLTKKWVK